MKKAPNGQFLLGALALPLAALFTGCLSTATPIAAELKPLQGYWEGEGAGGKCSLTITGNSLHYRAGTTWFETTFTLPAGTDPQQLHATIKGSSPPEDSIGTLVFAIFKIEDGTLTLALNELNIEEPPKTFPSALSAPQEKSEGVSIVRYDLKQVQPQKKNTQSPKTK